MSPIKILEDALSAGKDFGSLAGKLRDKFKSGTADLQAVYDEAESVVDSAVAKAKDGLAAFKSEVAKVEGDVKSVEGEMPNDGAAETETVKASDPAPASAEAVVTTPTPTTTIAVVPAAAEATPVLTGAGSVTVDPGTTVHTDTDTGVTTTVPHDGSDATAVSATGVPVATDPAVVSEAVQATLDAGVTLPEEQKADAPVPADQPQPVI